MMLNDDCVYLIAFSPRANTPKAHWKIRNKFAIDEIQKSLCVFFWS